MFDYNEETSNDILVIFKNNFKYKDEINSVEIIEHVHPQKIKKKHVNNQQSKIMKKIVPYKSDVYNVYNITTNNHDGILYIKSIEDSKKLRELTNGKEIILECYYNHKFKKWAWSYIKT